MGAARRPFFCSHHVPDKPTDCLTDGKPYRLSNIATDYTNVGTDLLLGHENKTYTTAYTTAYSAPFIPAFLPPNFVTN
jgi:hypothetical protein